MTDRPSRDESDGGGGRTTLPNPPRPPAPLHDDVIGDGDGDGVGEGAGGAVPDDDGGPRTSLAGIPAATDAPPLGYRPTGSYSQGGSLPADQLTSVGMAAPPVTPLPGDTATRPIGSARPVRGHPTAAARRDRRPQVALRGPRRSKLVIRRVDPWSVLKISFLFSICMLIVWVVAVGTLFDLLRSMNVFDNINQVLASATAGDGSKGISINPKSHDVTMWAAILGAVNALLFTALATLGAFLYNLIAFLVGGVECTLAERD
jgi:hypothetical protein